MASDISQPKILIVDDEPLIRDLLESAMERTEYPCSFAQDGQDALSKLEHEEFDIIVTDIDMPVMDGIELAKRVKADFTADVIVMTGQIHSYQYDEIITIGASDFVEKPFSPREMILRINRVVQERSLKQEAFKAHLATQKAHAELRQSYIDSIHRLVMASEFKDEDTGDHIVRIGEYCTLMGQKLDLSNSFIERIYYAAPMHDIGKIGIPDKILLKPGKLTKEEFETIKTHTTIGARILSRSNSKILQMAHDIALNHHEKFNGQGYPNQIKGIEIPIAGRICAIADTFDALTSKRPYKDPYPAEVTFEIMKKEREKHFDPDILDIFIKDFDQFLEIRGKIGPSNTEDYGDFLISERDIEAGFKLSN